jgi:hypothetical protein
MTKMRESVICIGKCLQIADIESSNVCVTNGSLTDYNGRNEGSLMPLRDHLRPPYSKLSSWEGFHGVWPAMMVQQLNDALPASFVAEPRVHLGTNFEIDVKESELDSPRSSPAIPAHTDGGVSTATYAPPKPTLTIEAELGPEYEYAVEVYDLDRGRHLVAAVEIVSPGNKDRPENRRAFVAKCEALLRRNVCVSIVDLVSIRKFNLFNELLEGLNQPMAASVSGSPLYAVTCRNVAQKGRWRLESWPHDLVLGETLPELPLWISNEMAVPVKLEASYEAACRTLRIP